jgi:hypothetical protein
MPGARNFRFQIAGDAYMRRNLILCAAAGLAGLCLSSAASAADFRVIKWNITGVCQIYDFGWGGRPIPPNYRVLTRPLPTFGAALRAKDSLARRGRCTL